MSVLLTREAISCSRWEGQHLGLLAGSFLQGYPGSWQYEQQAGHSWAALGCSYSVCCVAGSGHWCTLLGCCFSHWVHNLQKMVNGLFILHHFASYKFSFTLAFIHWWHCTLCGILHTGSIPALISKALSISKDNHSYRYKGRTRVQVHSDTQRDQTTATICSL